MNIQLDKLRQEIDSVDDQLLDLIGQRLALVNQVGDLKSKAGLSLHDPTREAEIIARIRDKAIARQLSPDFFEDILKRLMQEAYANETGSGYSQIKPDCGTIIIVGGRGKMGKLLCEQFRLSGYVVDVLEENDQYNQPSRFANAGLVLIAVPIAKTLEVINQLPVLPSNCILADVTSIKSSPLNAMLAVHKGPVVGLHPMFGPDITTFVKQLIITCDGRFPEEYEWLIAQIKIWGSRVESCTAEEHDKSMAYIQALRHFITFVYGSFLLEENVDLNVLLNFSSPIYRLELAMVGRMFSQNPELYADIILASDYNLTVIKRHFEEFDFELTELSQKGRLHFMERFDLIARYFGKYGHLFQSETGRFLEK